MSFGRGSADHDCRIVRNTALGSRPAQPFSMLLSGKGGLIAGRCDPAEIENRRMEPGDRSSLITAVLWNGLLIAPYSYLATNRSPADPKAVLSLVSLNVHTANLNKSAAVNDLSDKSADLIVVMELDNDRTAALQELSDRNKQLNKAALFVATALVPTIVAGDFNATP